MNKKKNYKFIQSSLIICFLMPVLLSFNYCTKPKETKKDKKDYLQIQRRKLFKTKMDIKTLGDAIMQYVASTGKAPDISKISELRNLDFPYFANLRELNDAWGNAFLYKRDADDLSSYFIASAGKDGKFEGWGQSGTYNVTVFEHYNKDIIYSNGGFLYTSN